MDNQIHSAHKSIVAFGVPEVNGELLDTNRFVGKKRSLDIRWWHTTGDEMVDRAEFVLRYPERDSLHVVDADVFGRSLGSVENNNGLAVFVDDFQNLFAENLVALFDPCSLIARQGVRLDQVDAEHVVAA